MLVLSRRECDTVTFPDLGITIEVLRLKGNSVRLGVEAPIEVKVLRGELEDKKAEPSRRVVLGDARNEHQIRNKLNTLNVAISLAERYVGANQAVLAANILERAITDLELDSPSPDSFGEFYPKANEEECSDTPKGLLVEDSDNERTMLAGLLRLHGFHVDTVEDGSKAIDYLNANPKPDFILMDMCMPNLDGASAIRQIRQSPAFDDVEIFAVSGQTPKLAGIDMSRNRIANWFQKPLDPRILLSAIGSQSNEAMAN